jgi:hypothetical protein
MGRHSVAGRARGLAEAWCRPAFRKGVLVSLFTAMAMLPSGCRDRDDGAPKGAVTSPTVGQPSSVTIGSRLSPDGGRGSKPARPTGFERPLQLIYDLDVRRLPREWQPHGVSEASARLAGLLRQLLVKQGLVGRVDVQLEPAPTIRLSFRDLLPAEQAALVGEIKSQGEASSAVMGGVKLSHERLGQDPVRVREGCERRAGKLGLGGTEAPILCAAWGSLPDALRHCVDGGDLWGVAGRCAAGQEPEPGALISTILPCLEAHAAEGHLALRGGLVAIIDLSQPKPPDGAQLTTLVRRAMGEQGPPSQVRVTGRDGSYRLQVMVAYAADTQRDLKAFGQSLSDWLEPGLSDRPPVADVHWVGPSVSKDSLKQYCGLLKALPKGLPKGLQGCLSHPAVRGLCGLR